MADKKELKNVADSEAITRNEDGVTYYRGKAFLPHFSWKTVKYAIKEWEMPQNTVIVASYLKTGTAWCMELTRQLLSRGNDDILRNTKSIPMPTFLLESSRMEKFDQYPNLPIKVVMTHMTADLFNFDQLEKSNSKIIYMYRNPKDQAVSWYHFAGKTSSLNKEQRDAILGKDWNDFFAKFTAGKHPTGMAKGEWYPDHLKGWMDQAKVNGNILPVEYESLKKDFPNELKRIAKFLGVDVSKKDVGRINERCTVDAMKKGADCDKSGFLKVNVRKGEVGGWKEHLTESQSYQMDRLIEEKLAGTGIKFTYEL